MERMMTNKRVLAILITGASSVLSACEDVAEPPDLDHDRIIAVRATPPRAAPGGLMTIDGLVTDEAATVRVAQPVLAAVVLPSQAPAELVAMTRDIVVRSGDSWTIAVPGAETLAIARTAVGLGVDDPIPLRVSVVFEIAGRRHAAEKLVLLGEEGENPVALRIVADSAPVDDVLAISMPSTVALRSENTGEVTRFAWLTSIGALEKYFEPEARLVVDEPGPGQLVVVVRDDRGGVAWHMTAVTTGPP